MDAVGDADGLAVTQHGFAGFQVVERDLVRLGNALARHESIGQERAGRRTFGVHQDGDVVAGVYANVHGLVIQMTGQEACLTRG